MIGQRISHYEIVDEIGKGGMGVVYKALDTHLNRTVALKFLPSHLSSDDEANERFIREAKAASALEHPNICTIHDIDSSEDGKLFIVMGYYKGETLKEKLAVGRLTVEESLNLATQIAEGLAGAHEEGIVHRDIKPANVMVTHRGDVKILDFGVAKLTGAVDLTKTGSTVGTASYMSPEQARGEEVDGRSDLWSLGVVLYEMLTGQKPFSGDYDQAVAYSILNQDPESVCELNDAIPDYVAVVVRQLLEKDANDRYQTARQVVEVLSAQDEAVSMSSRDANKPRYRKVVLGVGMVVLIGFLMVFANEILDMKRAPGEKAEAARLAVLPFSNMRSDPATDFLGYALADQVIGSLEYIKNLNVRPSNSVRKYQQGDYDLSSVGDDLAVNYVLAGNYLQQGDMMRLTVELIDLEDGQTVWREPIEVAYQSAFEMQDLVSERLLARLEVSFSDDERNRMTADVSNNPLAYEYYLRSLSYPEDAEGNQLGVNMLEQSIELDSTFAPAWDALGRRAQVAAYWELGGEQVMNQAQTFFEKALALNPDLFSALAHMAMLYTDIGETDLSMEIVLRMLEINPNSAVGNFAYGYVLRYAGMLEESATAMDTALEIDPTNPMFRSAAFNFVQNGRYDDAIKTFYLGTRNLALAWEGEIAIRQGQFDKARSKLSEAIAADPKSITGLWATGLLSALDGDRERGIEAAHRWEEANLIDGEGWFYLAGIYCRHGEIEKCISLVDRAVAAGAFEYSHFLKCPFLDPARGNPAFDAVLDRALLKHEAFKSRFF